MPLGSTSIGPGSRPAQRCPPEKLAVGIALVAAGSSIAALLMYAADLVPMPYGISFITLPGLILFVALVAWARQSRATLLLNRLTVGTLAGIAATAAYDASRWLLVETLQFDFNPWGPITAFGTLMTGNGRLAEFAGVAGWAYHLSNGWTFGLAYCIIAGPARWPWAVLWALVLEAATLLIYPIIFQDPCI